MTPVWVPKIPHPARGAYAYADMDRQCPNCGAEPWEWCRAGHSHPRRVPCVARISKLPDPLTDSTLEPAANPPRPGRPIGSRRTTAATRCNPTQPGPDAPQDGVRN